MNNNRIWIKIRIMAGLISTGIWGFICSATMKAGKITSTFISGATGWIIRNNGDAEFKSIYARDKIVTNEYVYNRIRVTEDEEVISSNGKILASFLNDDGSYNIRLDLREGDMNPFAANDLLQGYYHSPGNAGVIYAVQKMSVMEVLDDQTMNVTCLSGSTPYKYMVVVRVGNTSDTARQSFIRISSRTNCQYFYDGIASFVDLDNPDKVKCAIGKADVGLIPSWAAKVTGSVKRWFGLIADGVILRGTFVLKTSGTTVEEELGGISEKFVDIETKFEIREGQISSKITRAETSAENAEQAAQTATSKASEATQAVEEFSQKVSESTTVITDAVKTAQDAASGAAGSADAAAESAKTATTKASEVVQTAEGFKTTVTEETKKAVKDAVAGADDAITEKVSTQVTQSARDWKVEVLNGEDTVLAAINADESGVKIEGNKVQITGELLAEIIKAEGLVVGNKSISLNKDGSGYLANENIRWDANGNPAIKGKLTTSFNGKRIEIDPERNDLRMYDPLGKLMLQISFYHSDKNDDGCAQIYMYRYFHGELYSELIFQADEMQMRQKFQTDMYVLRLSPFLGITRTKNGKGIDIAGVV